MYDEDAVVVVVGSPTTDLLESMDCLLRPRPYVSGDFCIRKFFSADTPSVHTCPPYTLGVSGDFCIRSPEWKFLYTLCIRIRVNARIRIFLYTLTSQAQLSL